MFQQRPGYSASNPVLRGVLRRVGSGCYCLFNIMRKYRSPVRSVSLTSTVMHQPRTFDDHPSLVVDHCRPLQHQQLITCVR